jgi:hypothetical protein
MKAFDYLIYFTFFIKIIFIGSAISIKYLEHKNKNANTQTLVFWKERSEFIFKACLSLILILLFNPRRKTPLIINTETKLLLYLYGFIVILQANWGQFLKESPLNHSHKSTQQSTSNQNQNQNQ